MSINQYWNFSQDHDGGCVRGHPDWESLVCVRNREEFLNYNIEYITYELVDVETKGAPFKRYVENAALHCNV